MDKKGRVLVVDGRQDVVTATLRLLNAEGYEGLGAANGAECLQMAKTRQPDLILLSPALPDISGVDLCKQIRLEPDLADVFVVLTSTQEVPSAIQARGLEAGADAYIVRPLPNRELVARLDSLLRRRNTAVELRTTMQGLQTTLDAISDAVYVVNLEGRIVRCNTALAKLLGKPISEIIGQSCSAIVHGTPERIDACLLQRVRDTEHREALIVPLKERWLQVVVDPLFNEDGHVIAGVHVMSDVTERRLAEEALQREDYLMSVMVNRSPAWAVVSDPNGRIVRLNQTCELGSGYTQVEVQGKLLWDVFLAPEEASEARTAFYALHDGRFASELESTWVNKDGRRRRIAWANTPVQDNKGVIDCVVTTGVDVSERDMARAVVDRAGAWVAVLDPAGKIVGLNRAFTRSLGFSAEEMKGKPLVDLVAAADAEAVQAQLATLTAAHPFPQPAPDGGGEATAPSPGGGVRSPALHFENRFTAKDGSQHWIAWSAMPLRDPRRELQRIVCSGLDVTARHLATGHALDWTYEWDVSGGKIIWSAAGAGQSGVGMPADSAAWEAALHPDDRGRVVSALQGQLSSDRPFATEYRVQGPDGTVRHWLDRSTVLRDSQGNALMRAGAVRDVTEHSEAERTLHACADAAWRWLGTPIAEAALVDRSGAILAVNSEFARRLGRASSTLVGQDLFELLPPEVAAERKAQLERVLQSGEPAVGVSLADGRRVEAGVHPLRDAQGQITRLAVLATDQTERRRALAEWDRLLVELAQARQTEAVRALANRAASEFNSLATVIMGTAEISLTTIEPAHPLQRKLATMHKAAKRVAGLTGEMAARSQLPAMKAEAVDLNALATQFGELLQNVMDPAVKLRLDLAPELQPVQGDRGLLWQALASLAINAWDAAPRDGTLSIETARRTLEPAFCQAHPEVKPGEYVRLSVGAAHTPAVGGEAPAAGAGEGRPRSRRKEGAPAPQPRQGDGETLRSSLGGDPRHVGDAPQPRQRDGETLRSTLGGDPRQVGDAPQPLPGIGGGALPADAVLALVHTIAQRHLGTLVVTERGHAGTWTELYLPQG